MGFIDAAQLRRIAERIKNEYGRNLLDMLRWKEQDPLRIPAYLRRDGQS